MEWKTDLQILRALPVRLKGQLIRIIYNIIDEHKGVDFKDLEDLMQQIYPPRTVEPVAFGVNVRKPRKWQDRVTHLEARQ